MKKLLFITILIATSFFLILISKAEAMIAFDAAVGSPNTAASSTTPKTWNHTTTGSNRILFISVFSLLGSDNVSGATYNGVAMTLVDKIAEYRGYYLYLFYLINPNTGTNAVSVSLISASNDSVGGTSASYTGAKQSGQPDASNKSTVASGATISHSVTSTVDNAWFVSTGFMVNQSAAIVAGTGLTKRAGSLVNGVSDAMAIGDSNAPKTPAGVHSMTWNFATTDSINMISASFAPVEPPPPSPTMQVIWWE